MIADFFQIVVMAMGILDRAAHTDRPGQRYGWFLWAGKKCFAPRRNKTGDWQLTFGAELLPLCRPPCPI